MLGLPDAVEACLFDLDGVLTDTAAVHYLAWQETFDAFLGRHTDRNGVAGAAFTPEDAKFTPEGSAFTPDDYVRHVDGKPRADGVRDFLSSRGVELPTGDPGDPPGAATVHGVGNHKNEVLLNRLRRDGVAVFEGSRRYLEATRDRGLRRAVVSSSANAREVLRVTGLAGLVEQTIDAGTARELGLRGKPFPDTFLEAASRLGVPPARAVVFEDSLAGVQAGRAGNFGGVVGVDRGNNAAALRASGAQIVVTDLADLLDGVDD